MAGDTKSDNYQRDDYNAGRGTPTEDSQSPRAHRGTAQDCEQFQKGDVQTNVASGSRSEGTDRGFDQFPGKGNDGSF